MAHKQLLTQNYIQIKLTLTMQACQLFRAIQIVLACQINALYMKSNQPRTTSNTGSPVRHIVSLCVDHNQLLSEVSTGPPGSRFANSPNNHNEFLSTISTGPAGRRFANLISQP